MKWMNLSNHAKINFLYACVVLVVIKTGLTILPFGTFRKLFHYISSSRKKTDVSKSGIDELISNINAAASALPFELLCLPRALAAKYMLRKVPDLSLEIGIEVNKDKAFEAHAWVEKNGNVIIGDWSESVSYQRLWVWE